MGRKKTIASRSAPADQTRRGSTQSETPSQHRDVEKRLADEQWVADMKILRRAAEELTHRRMSARVPLPSLESNNSSYRLAESLDYSSEEARNQAFRAFYKHNPDRAASLFTVSLREGSPEQRRRIGAALVGSGLVSEAIEVLTGVRNEDSYSAYSLLVLAAKAGQIGPLVDVIETHTSLELRLKLIRLMVSSGERVILDAFRRLVASKSLPGDLRAAIVEAIHRLNSQARETAA